MKRVYILPTRHGVAFLALIVVIILVGAASGNNLIYALAFTLFAVYMLVMIATNANLKSLQVDFVESEDCFVGEVGTVRLRLTNPHRRAHFMISAQASQKPKPTLTTLSELPALGQALVSVPVQYSRRGKHRLPGFVISTNYPLGLFRSWSVVRLNEDIYVYPLKKGELQSSSFATSEGIGPNQQVMNETHHEDFREHARYQLGESHHHVDWKAYARSGEMLSKRYETSSPLHHRLDWSDVAHLPTEEALSQLSRWIAEFQKDGKSFELHLPQSQLGPGQGELHSREALRMLSLYPDGGAQ